MTPEDVSRLSWRKSGSRQCIGLLRLVETHYSVKSMYIYSMKRSCHGNWVILTCSIQSYVIWAIAVLRDKPSQR